MNSVGSYTAPQALTSRTAPVQVLSVRTTYVYRTSGGAVATATSLPLPAGGVLLKVATS